MHDRLLARVFSLQVADDVSGRRQRLACWTAAHWGRVEKLEYAGHANCGTWRGLQAVSLTARAGIAHLHNDLGTNYIFLSPTQLPVCRFVGECPGQGLELRIVLAGDSCPVLTLTLTISCEHSIMVRSLGMLIPESTSHDDSTYRLDSTGLLATCQLYVLHKLRPPGSAWPQRCCQSEDCIACCQQWLSFAPSTAMLTK